MSLITYDELVDLCQSNVIEGVAPDRINAASIDVTLGDTLWVEASPNGLNTMVDLIQKETPAMEQIDLQKVGFYSLAPGQFCLAQTREVFHLPEGIVMETWYSPSIAGEYKLKSSMARAGLGHLLAGWCFTGDTEIVLADGSARPISSLVSKTGIYVYSVPGPGKCIIAEAENVVCTGTVTDTVKIYLNNDRSFECTDDHLIRLHQTGEYMAAAKLKPGTKLASHALTDDLVRGTVDLNSPYEVVAVALRKYAEPIPVYDMTVPVHHNYALAAGVFAHNCDPGWNGSVLTLEFVNHLKYHSLTLRPGMRCGQIVLWRGDPVPNHASYATKGRYNGDLTATPSKGVGQ
jgi:deoxycytidine triphosphate deaminase